jgi:hypothetical protein
MTQQKKSGMWKVALVPVGLAAVMTPAILLAANGAGMGSGGFDEVVRGIEHRYHVHANKIPFMGLISFVAGRATHGGVRGLHVAEIENVDGPIDGDEFNALVEEKAGKGWQRIIRETSRKGDNQNLILVRPEGDHLGMLVVSLDGREMNIVQLSMNPDQLTDEMAKHRHHRDDDDKDTDAKGIDNKNNDDKDSGEGQ